MARKLVFSRVDGDAEAPRGPIEDLPLRENAGARGNLRRGAVIAGAVGLFVFLNAALLGYLPFMERRPAPSLRTLSPAAPRVSEAPAPPSATPPAPEAPTAGLAPSLSSPPVLRTPAADAGASANAQAASATTPAPPSPAPLRQTAPPPQIVAAAAPPRLGARPQGPAAALTPAPAPAPAPASRSTLAAGPATSPGGADGGIAVQVGAFATDALAADALERATAAGPRRAGALATRREPVEKGGSTLYRAVISGFATAREASAYCAALKGAGMACFVRR